MDQGDRPASLEGAEYRDRHPVVAADGDDHGARADDLARGRLGAGIVAAGLVVVARHVAAVDHAHLAAVERGAAQVEVVLARPHADARRFGAHRRGRVDLVLAGAELVVGIGIAVG